ncbi:hypothetical protein LXL04_025497 [Taraxacum kok-saghyz]
MQPTILNLMESSPLKPKVLTMGMKGHPQSGGAGGGGWKKDKRKVAVMAVLLLVGVMGLMVVQKVRDRRMFNQVIKDKDRQILSLHLLFQKERQFVKEHKKKNQDLNAKLFSLRTQKTELHNKLMEMRSTIGSMREEQRALELTIDEIKHQESKITDLKSDLRSSPPKIWSVSSDDPSTRELNLTKKATSTINPSVQVQNPSVDHEEEVKSKMKNTTVDVKEKRENVTGLSVKGRRSFIGEVSEGGKGTWTKSEGERKDEDEDVSMESSNSSDADQDYKDEMED